MYYIEILCIYIYICFWEAFALDEAFPTPPASHACLGANVFGYTPQRVRLDGLVRPTGG